MMKSPKTLFFFFIYNIVSFLLGYSLVFHRAVHTALGAVFVSDMTDTVKYQRGQRVKRKDLNLYVSHRHQ